ncbi:hypothetical protein DF947_13820 [Pedobacter paludis]|uniref:Uncharacterized protein n=1 Tax=Pedobacter paludis TaxID=2203212 RepID=A0A317F2F4_9SPHI|nr:hypothetical protein DF947_13820 [Pedobacter paludis]
MKGENVKAFAEIFIPPLSKATRPARFFIGYLCCRSLSFNEFIRHQAKALIFCFFSIKRKERAPGGDEPRKETSVKQ